MPQLLTTPLPSSPDTERQRLFRQWLSDTPELNGPFTDSQGNVVPLPWNEYTNVNPAGKAAPSVSTLLEFPRSNPCYQVGCGPESSYTAAIRVRVGMGNILSAREVLNDILAPLSKRLKETMLLDLNGTREKYKWHRSERSPDWTFTKEIKNGDGTPGGNVTALGVFVIKPCRG